MKYWLLIGVSILWAQIAWSQIDSLKRPVLKPVADSVLRLFSDTAKFGPGKIKSVSPEIRQEIKSIGVDVFQAIPQGNYLKENFFFKNNKSSQEELKQFSIDALRPGAERLMIIADDQLEKPSARLIIPDQELEPSVNRKRRLMGVSQFDSRIEIRALDPLDEVQLRMRRNASAVGLVIRREELQQVNDSMFAINNSITLSRKYGLCAGEAFSDQPVGGVGTAFLTNDQHIMSACHVFEGNVGEYAFVLGFEMINTTGAFITTIPVSNIYYLREVRSKNEELDVITILLDRPANREPLKLSAFAACSGMELYMVGHPCGLPQKISVNARVAGDSLVHHFNTTLDAFQGNSGSPIFRIDTHEVVGILVSGEVDYRWNGSCNSTTICSLPFCKGEKAVRITEFVAKPAED